MDKAGKDKQFNVFDVGVEELGNRVILDVDVGYEG